MLAANAAGSVILNILCTLAKRGAASPLKPVSPKRNSICIVVKQQKAVRLSLCWCKAFHTNRAKFWSRWELAKTSSPQCQRSDQAPVKWKSGNWQLLNSSTCKNIAFLMHVPGRRRILLSKSTGQTKTKTLGWFHWLPHGHKQVVSAVQFVIVCNAGNPLGPVFSA